MTSVIRKTFLGLLVLGAISCSKSKPAPEKEPAATTASASPVASAASAERIPDKPSIPTLLPEPFEATKGLKEAEFFPIDGALMVADDRRVGRIVGERVEWVGSVPEGWVGMGGSWVRSVHGYWPDGVDAHYTTREGRALQPTLTAITGKGSDVVFAEGGGLAFFFGTARLGETTVVAGYDMMRGYRFETLRGPTRVIDPILAKHGGCTGRELESPWPSWAPIAVPFHAMAATSGGTLVTVGDLCDRPNTPAAEIWDEAGKSRIVELGSLTKRVDYFAPLLPGKANELWLESEPILQYKEGKFEALPKLDKPIRDIFVSPSGKLHGVSGHTIQRFEDGKWVHVANLHHFMTYSRIAVDEQGTYWVQTDKISRLREGEGADYKPGCANPFVYLYDVALRNSANYTFPATQKALSTFADVKDLELVEYLAGGRRLGVRVKSKEQGEAVVAHVMANMKDEHPELLCYTPKNVRVIDMKKK